MQIILHIGMHKTGTTSVQKWLRDHQLNMQEQGIAVFPLDPRIVVRRQDLFDPVGLRQHLQELEIQGVERVIFSHEALSTFSKAHVQTLRQALYPFPVRTVVVFRHWSSFLPSRWRQNCKRRDGQSFGRYLERIFAAPKRFDMHFHQVLENFSPGAGDEVVVVPFERAVQGEGIVKHVLASFGLADTFWNSPKGIGADYHLNISEPSLDLEVLRLVNCCYAQYRGWGDHEMFAAFGEGRLFQELFDLGRVCTHMVQRNPDLWADLSERLNVAWRISRLRQSDFSELELRLEEAAHPYLDSEFERSMFPDLPDEVVRWAALEARDLPETLRGEVVQSLKSSAQEIGWQPSFPAAVARSQPRSIN